MTIDYFDVFKHKTFFSLITSPNLKVVFYMKFQGFVVYLSGANS